MTTQSTTGRAVTPTAERTVGFSASGGAPATPEDFLFEDSATYLFEDSAQFEFED